MKRNIFQKILNYLSGATMCVAGGVLIIKGQTAAGVTLIVSGITKISAHEMQSKEIKEVKKEITGLPEVNNKGL